MTTIKNYSSKTVDIEIWKYINENNSELIREGRLAGNNHSELLQDGKYFLKVSYIGIEMAKKDFVVSKNSIPVLTILDDQENVIRIS